MFGYITPYKSEMKIKDYNKFRAYYCGLCKSLGQEYNQLVRMGLNYDLAFLGILLSSLEDSNHTIKYEKCIVNPMKKKMIIRNDKALNYTSDVSVMLAYFKLIDDWNDERSIKSLFANIPYKLSIKKVKRKHQNLYNNIDEKLKDLSKLEKNKCNIVDEVASVFAKIMEIIAVPEYIENDGIRRILKFLGYNLGRWIYILDAVDDIEEDINNNNYNPILLQYEYDINENIVEFYKRIKKPIEFSMTISLQNISKALELLNIKQNRAIIDNIVYMGMRYKMENIINSLGGDKYEESI